MLVLPLVPVTATTVSGRTPARTAAISASIRRGSGSVSSTRGGTSGGQCVPFGASTATAPFLTASGMKSRPSTNTPGTATNRSPRLTCRLSAVTRPISNPATILGSGRDEPEKARICR